MAYEKQTFINNKTLLTAEHLNHIEDGIIAGMKITEDVIASIKGRNVRMALAPINTISGHYINHSGALVESADHSVEVYDVSHLDSITVIGSNSQNAITPVCVFGEKTDGSRSAYVINNTDALINSLNIPTYSDAAFLFITVGANHCLQVFGGNINDETDKRISAIEEIIGTSNDAVEMTPAGTLSGVYLTRDGAWRQSSATFVTDYYKVSVGEHLRIYCESTNTAYGAWSFSRTVPSIDVAPNHYYRAKTTTDGLWIDDAVSPYDGYLIVSHTWDESARVYSKGLYLHGMTGLYIGDSISYRTAALGFKSIIEQYHDIKYARDISGIVPPANGSLCVIPPETEEDALSKKSIWYRCSNRNMDAYQFDFINLFGGTNDLALEGFDTTVLGTIDDTPYLDTTETRPETVTFASALMGCVEMLQRDFPDKPLILCTIMPMVRSTQETREAMAVLQCKIAAKYNIPCVPWYWDMNSAAFRMDTVHPNEVGTMRMAGLWINAVKKYLDYHLDKKQVITTGFTTTYPPVLSENGLIMCCDGVNNTGNGHDANVTTWTDLSGNGNDLINVASETATTAASAVQGEWLDDGIHIVTANNQLLRTVNTFDIGADRTLEMRVTLNANDNMALGFKAADRVKFRSDGANFWVRISESDSSGTVDLRNLGATVYETPITVTITRTYNEKTDTTTYAGYTNGVFKNALEVAGNYRIGESTHLLFGMENDDVTIHAVRVYNRALTSDEILRNYNYDVVHFPE